YMIGSVQGGAPPKFCAPSQRRVVAVTGTERGQFSCGSLKVHFTFEAPDHPDWAHSDSSRARAAQALDPPAGAGEVTLSRQWYGRNNVPLGFTNGWLQSACLDQTQTQVVGNDLTLHAGGS